MTNEHKPTANDKVAEALDNNFFSVREIASNGAIGANMVDGLFAIASALYAIARAIREHDEDLSVVSSPTNDR